MASSTGGSGGGGASDDIVEAVKKYFFEDSDFEGTFLGWAQAHCDPIDMESEEMKLEYTALHNEFMAFFENHLEAFIKEKGSDVKDFYTAIKKKALDDPEGDDSLFIQIMLAAVEFDVFVQMMRDAKRLKKEAEDEAAEKAAADDDDDDGDAGDKASKK